MVYTSKDKVRVVIATTTYRVEGDMHLLAGSRLTDALNSKAKDFFAVTDAKVFNPTGDLVLFEPEYLAVNRDSISLIFPL
ncbi:MAG: hypothetical protein Q8K89_02200 [Actinomycetota bacterium]|nr:hypothetical protein [Actinomycetota bacterium]